MKVLLRNTRTGLYYAGSDQWTGQHGEARDFETPDLAMAQADAVGLAGVEVIAHFDNPGFDLPLTIHSAGGV